MNSAPSGSKTVYALIGGALGAAVGIAIALVGGREMVPFVLSCAVLGMLGALIWGRRRGALPSVEEDTRPKTLFDASAKK